MSKLDLGRIGSARVAQLFLISLLWACSAREPMKAGWEYDPAATFVGLRSYAWDPDPARETGDTRTNDRHDKRIRKAISTQLAAQGFMAVPPEQADFWVAYHVRLVDKVKTSTIDSSSAANRAQGGGNADLYRYWLRGGSQSTYQQRQDIGTLTVFIDSPATRAPIWQGYARAEIRPSDDRETRDQALAAAAVMILEKFPPTAP